MMALALRDPDPPRVRSILDAFSARSLSVRVRPYARSVMEHPSLGTPDELRLHIAGFLVGDSGGGDFVCDYLPYLAEGAAPSLHQQIAFKLLKHATFNDNVLAGYVRHFCAGHPDSAEALRWCLQFRRPEIEEGLLAELDREERKCRASGEGADTTNYVLLASFLSRIGNKRAREVMAQHRKRARRTREPATLLKTKR
jgi:hypothetical protein